MVAGSGVGRGDLHVFDGRVFLEQHQPHHHPRASLAFSSRTAETLEAMHFVIRKCAHFTEYFILSLLVLRCHPRGPERKPSGVGTAGDCAGGGLRVTRRVSSVVCAGAHGGSGRCADRHERRRGGAIVSGTLCAVGSCAGTSTGETSLEKERARTRCEQRANS